MVYCFRLLLVRSTVICDNSLNIPRTAPPLHLHLWIFTVLLLGAVANQFHHPAFLALIWSRFRQRGLLKIPGPSNPSLIWGHWLEMYNPRALSFYERLYGTYGSVTRVYGFLGDIQLVVSDPKACNNIFVKDQLIFEETEAFLMQVFSSSGNPGLVPNPSSSYMQTFGPSLLSTTGTHHRRQRKLLNPVFSVNHMRHMAPIFHRVAQQLREKLELIVEKGAQEINIADWMGKFALELIGQAGLGYSFGTLDGRNDEYCKALLPWPKLNHLMDLAETLNAEARRIYESKRRLLELGDDATVKQVEESKDIIGLLSGYQTAILVFTATDTTSSALSRILHLLALHPNVQDKLRKELKEACEVNEELPHDRLVSLPFLEAVCRETLRVYPPFPGVMRTTRSDSILPLSSPIHDVDGREVHEIFVPKDTNRWLSPLPESVTKANIQGVYANTMTFIGGARSCIGFKFSQLEMKVALSHIIPAFRLAPAEAEIVWRFGGILTPSVNESVNSTSPQLPVIISRA
ncbi:cytochrome P450 [Lactarius quietus]|nr:cytochrome P450 [Lactarius quietus]